LNIKLNQMQNLTFEQLPAAVALLLEKIERIEKLLSGMEDKKPSEYLDISKAAAYLNLARATVYSKVCRREIPAYKNGSRLYFKRDENLGLDPSYTRDDN
jgi:excisionase family DNA binding protein